jgi:hypothetical protein
MATNLTQIRIEASLDASGYVSAAQKKSQADQQMVDSGNKVATALDATDRRLNQSSGLNRFLQQNDAALKAVNLYESGVRRLDAALAAGSISQDTYNRQVGLIADRYNAGLAAASKNEQSLKSLGNTIKDNTNIINLNRGSLLSLQASGINAFQALAAGISPLRVAVTESAQAIGALVQGGVGLRALGLLFGPIGIAAVAAATAIGTLVAGVTRLASTQQNIKDFQLTLSALGEDGKTSGAALQQAFQQIRDSGTSAADALKAVQAVARDPLVNQARATEIIALARDIGVVTGEDLPQAQQKLQKALSGGIDSVIKYGQSLNALSADQAAQIRQTGNLDIAVRALQERFGGKFQESLTATDRASQSITTAWNHLLDTFAQTTIFQTVYDKIIQVLDAIARLPDAVSRGVAALKELAGIGGAGPSASAIIPPSSGALSYASQAELQVLAQVRQNESGGRYGILHSTGQDISGLTLTEIQAMPGPSHAFGAYGFQPDTYRRFAANPNDLSPAAQDAAALNLLRFAGPNSSLSWQASAPRGGYPTAGLQMSGAIAGLPTQQQVDVLKQAQEANDRLNASLKQTGALADATRAFYEAYNSTQGKSLDQTNRTALAQDAFNQVLVKAQIEFGKETTEAAKLVQATANVADAFITSEAAGLRAQAAVEATRAVFERFGTTEGHAADIIQQTNLALEQQAATAISSGEQQARAFDKTISANEALAAASAKGTKEFQAEQIVIQAAAQTQDALAKALASGNPALIARAEALQAETEAQLKSNQAAQQSTQLNQRAEQVGQDVQVVQLEAQLELQGKTSVEIANQVSLLRLKQDLEGKYANASEASKASITAQVEALGKANIALDEARQRTERWNEELRSIADTVASAIGSALDDILSGKKIDDWGARFKSVLSSIASQIIQSELIKPALGSALQSLGASGSTVQQFGTLGQGGGILSNLFGGGSGSSSGILGAIGNLFGLGGQGAAGLPEFSTIAGATQGVFDFGEALGGATTAVEGAAGILGPALGAIGTAIPYVGAAIAIGTLISSFFGPKPSTLASGSVIDLASGRVGDVRSSGNAQNDQTVQNISSTLSKFLGELQKTTGGTIAGGSLNVVATTKGIMTHYSGPLGDISGTFSSAQDAIQALETAFLHNLTGVSDTLKTVLDHISDPSQIQAAVAFAKTYDEVGTAFDALTKSAMDLVTPFQDASHAIGPYTQAFQKIDDQQTALKAQYDQLASSAQQYGLSLDPIDDAYRKATDTLIISQQSLREAFSQNFADAAAKIVDPFTAALNDEVAQAKQRLADAKAIGADTTSVQRYNEANLGRIAIQASSSLGDLGTHAQDFAGQFSDSIGKVLDNLEQSARRVSLVYTSTGVAQLTGHDAFSQAFNQIAQQGAALIEATKQYLLSLGVTSQDVFTESFKKIYDAINMQVTRLAGDFNENIRIMYLQLTDPRQAAIEAEKKAAQDRLTIAHTLGIDQAPPGSMGSAEYQQLLDYNAKKLQQVIDQTKNSTDDLANALAAVGPSFEDAISSVVKTSNGPFEDALASLNKSFTDTWNNLVKLGATTDQLNGVTYAYTVNQAKLRDTLLASVGPSLDQAVAPVVQTPVGPYEAALDALKKASGDAYQTLLKLGATAEELAGVTYAVNVNLEKLRDTLLNSVPSSFQEAISSVIQTTKGPFESALDALNKAAGDAWQTLLKLGGSTAQFNDILNSFNANLAQLRTSFLHSVPGSFEDAISPVVQTTTGPFTSALTALNKVLVDSWNTTVKLGGSTADLNDVAISYNANLQKLRDTFTANTKQQILQITDPFQAALNEERHAARQRIADAMALGLDLGPVYELNALNLKKLRDSFKANAAEAVNFVGALDTLRQTLASIRSGPLSGKTPAQNALATLDDFMRELAAVRAGNYGEVQNLSSAAQAAIQASQAAYGNSAQTAALRKYIEDSLKAIKDVVKPKAIEQLQLEQAQKQADLQQEALNEQKYQTEILNQILKGLIKNPPPFATGTEFTPPGPITVGERGPEILYQRGGNTVVPFDKMIAANENAMSDVKGLLRAILRQTQAGQGQANKDAKMIASETAGVSRKIVSYTPPSMRNVG